MKNNFLLLLFLFLVNFCSAQNDVVLPRKVDILTGLTPEPIEPSFQTAPVHPYVPLPDMPDIKTSKSPSELIKQLKKYNSASPMSQSETTESENTFQKLENKSHEASNDLQPLDFEKELKKFKEEPKKFEEEHKKIKEEPSFQKQSEPTTFDWKKTNAQRFVNSPCLSTLGFDPNMDPQEQERLYKECEDAKSREKMEKYLKIGLGILLVLGFGGAIIYTFNKGQKNK